MKILTSAQIRALDAYTITHEPIKSIDLMERAALAFVTWFMQQFPAVEHRPINIFCGPGNNGGDGLAIARLLNRKHYSVVVFICQIGEKRSVDFEKNLKKIPSRRGLPVKTIKEGDSLPNFEKKEIIIDAILGSGLNRAITGYWATLIQQLNALPNEIVSVDIPSGLYADAASIGAVIHATYTLSFELPKRAFFFPENQDRLGNCYIQPIGLNQQFIQAEKATNYLITRIFVQSLLKSRPKFSHKGTFGHALLMVGSLGKMGAAILATKACLRSGVGLVTVQVPKSGYTIMQLGCPEAMTSIDSAENYLSEYPDVGNYKTIGIGCGIDQKEETEKALFTLLKKVDYPVVLDADALNILSKNKAELKHIPANSILTPHPKEFERLFGQTTNDFARNELQLAKAKALNCIILLKGANTAIAFPDGTCYFNSTGNPGMATGGSGDVLTGILTGLLAQGYSPKSAVIIGVYLHGLAGDLGAKDKGQDSLIAGDLVEYIGAAFLDLKG